LSFRWLRYFKIDLMMSCFQLLVFQYCCCPILENLDTEEFNLKSQLPSNWPQLRRPGGGNPQAREETPNIETNILPFFKEKKFEICNIATASWSECRLRARVSILISLGRAKLSLDDHAARLHTRKLFHLADFFLWIWKFFELFFLTSLLENLFHYHMKFHC